MVEIQEADRDDDEAYSGHTASALQGAANREFRNTLHSRIELVSSVRLKFDQADIDRFRAASRESFIKYASEFTPQIRAEMLAFSDTVSSGAQLSTRDYIHLKQALNLDSLDWAKKTREPKKEISLDDIADQTVYFGGLNRGDVVFLDSKTSLRDDGSATFDGSIKGEEMFDGSLKGEALFQALEDSKEKSDPYPVMPKRRATLVDSMSMISLLNQPRPFTAAEVDELFLRVGKKDPFAAAAFGQGISGTIGPKWLITEATAKEAKRILNEELGVDLTYQGQDFAMPPDWLHRDGPTVKLDPGRQRLVDGLLGLAVAIAQANKLSAAFSIDPGSPFGVTWTDRRYRAEQGSIATAIGSVQAAVGRELSPYMLDIKDPILSMLFPDGRIDYKNPGDRHPVQEYMREAGDFFLSFMLPGSNVKDLAGRHWVPKDIRSTVYSTINNLRQEFGAPQMGTWLTDDARIAPISYLKNASPEFYTRGWFGYNPGGKDILDWPKIRNAKESMEIMDPQLSTTSTLSKFSFVGGRLMDAYSGQELNIEDQYKLQSIEWNEKKGKWDVRAPRVSPYQLDHTVPLAYLWEHGYAQIADMVRHELNLNPDGTTATGDMPIRGLAGYLQPTSAALRGIGSTADTSMAMKAIQFMSRAGMGANPDQFHLAASQLNQDKGAKGPGGWMPFNFARTTSEHAINREYVRSFRSVISSEQRKFSELFGYDPGFLRVDRTDELAMRRVELGYDSTGRWTRWAADAYVNYFDMPDLQSPALYQRIRMWQAITEAKLAFGLSTWQFSWVNQLYLRGRRYIVDGFGQSFLNNPGTSFKDKSAAMWKWVRERQAGVPLLGASQMPKMGDDAIYTLHDIVRSGRIENIVDNATGESIHAFTGKMYAADPKSIWRYVGGEENAFGREAIRGARATESRFIPGFDDLARERYRAHLAGDIDAISPHYMQRLFNQGSLGQFPATSVQQQHWFKELGKWESLYSEMHGPLRQGEQWHALNAKVEDIFVNKSLLRGARETVRSSYSVARSSQIGRETLDAMPFIQELAILLKAGKGKELLRKGTLELLVKVVDYGIKGSLGVMEQLPAILGIEAVASRGASAMKPMVTVRPDYAHYDFSAHGGFFGWYDKVTGDARSLRDASRETTLRLIKEAKAARIERIAYNARWNRIVDFSLRTPDVLRRDLAHIESMMDVQGHSDFLARSASRLRKQIASIDNFASSSMLDFAVQNEQASAREISLIAALQHSREESFRISSNMKEMARLVDEEAPWIDRLARMPGARGSISRWAAQHPRIITNLAGVRNLPGDLARVAKSPFTLHAALADKIGRSDRLFKVFEDVDEAGKVSPSIGARLENNLVGKTLNKAASLKSVGTGVGVGLNVLAVVESGLRYREAIKIASSSWDSLGRDTARLASLEAYAYPSGKSARISTALDLGLPFTPWGAAQGLGLSLGNLMGRGSAMARAPIQFSEDHFKRMVLGTPNLQSLQRVKDQRYRNSRIGVLDSTMMFIRPAMANDTASYMSEIRLVAAKEDASQKVIDKKIQATRNAWNLIPRVDSLGYEMPVKMFGQESGRRLFKQVDQTVSDFSVVARPDLRPAITAQPEPYARADRAALLAQHADMKFRGELVDSARESKSILKKVWFYLAAGASQSYSQGLPNDSADALRDVRQIDSLRARK